MTSKTSKAESCFVNRVIFVPVENLSSRQASLHFTGHRHTNVFSMNANKAFCPEAEAKAAGQSKYHHCKSNIAMVNYTERQTAVQRHVLNGLSPSGTLHRTTYIAVFHITQSRVYQSAAVCRPSISFRSASVDILRRERSETFMAEGEPGIS